MSDPISPITGGSDNLALLLQIFALKKTEQAEAVKVTQLLSALSAGAPPAVPNLGGNVDVRL